MKLSLKKGKPLHSNYKINSEMKFCYIITNALYGVQHILYFFFHQCCYSVHNVENVFEPFHEKTNVLVSDQV